jgi:LPXTG-motif cell wall-anchored protein
LPAKRSLALALALLLVAAMPVRAATFPTVTVVDVINPGTANSSAMWSTGALGAYVYFGAETAAEGYELWRTDGSEADTTLVKNLYPGPNGSNPYRFTAMGDYLFFSADDGVHGYELWRTDGTAAGTILVKDINTSGDAVLGSFGVLGGYLYFNATSVAEGDELWRTDGSEAGTTLVKDINTGAGGSDISGFTEFEGRLYFQANDGANGTELWRTDGTTLGTTLVKDIHETGAGSPTGFTLLGDYLYFSADTSANGHELWRTNGTTAGTNIVADIYVGTNASFPYELTAFDGHLYFGADNGFAGYELWRYDGALAQRFADLITGPDGSYVSALKVVGGGLYGTFYNGAQNLLFRVDGETDLIQTVAVPGTNATIGCMCDPITVNGQRVYLTMYSDEVGLEFAFVDEPSLVLPETSTAGSPWSTALAVLAALTAAAGVALRRKRRTSN